MAETKGCYSGDIENGFVATSSCQVYTTTNVYCRYYCHDGYVKTASNVYCAGNNEWIPSGSHPSENAKACKKSTEPVSGCGNIFFDNGYVVTCPASSSSARKDCMYKCHPGYKPASTSIHCVRDEWVTSDSYSDPCIKDGSTMKTTTMTRRSTASPPRPPITTYPGYYDDPSLKMDVSPVIFVCAVIGGFIVLGLLIFTIFFRAHKKSVRDARTRSAFLATCDPLSLQNDYTNNNNDTQVDDSEFRDIARRIVAQSSNQQQQSSYSPPPYEAYSSNINPINQNTFSGPPSPPYTAVNVPATGLPEFINSSSSPQYSPVYNSGTGLQETGLYQPRDQMQIPQLNHTDAFSPDTSNDTSAITDKPPPYEDFQNDNVSHQYKDSSGDRTGGKSFDPPPPYTTHDGKG